MNEVYNAYKEIFEKEAKRANDNFNDFSILLVSVKRAKKRLEERMKDVDKLIEQAHTNNDDKSLNSAIAMQVTLEVTISEFNRDIDRLIYEGAKSFEV